MRSQYSGVWSLESGVFVNDGGKFTFKPFPRLAQIAPGFGIVAGDFDNDSLSDLYLVQNFYSPQAETGRMAGGVSLLLKGQGGGSFAAVAPRESGLYVGGDAKSLATADLNNDGRLDLVAGVNDDALVAFEPSSQSTTFLSLQLKGKNGNTQAAGSKITVKFDDGTQRVAEVSAGNSYLSQSSPLTNINIPKGAKVSGIKVRWPDGSLSTPSKADPGKKILIEQ